jgi:hypothetical protein
MSRWSLVAMLNKRVCVTRPDGSTVIGVLVGAVKVPGKAPHILLHIKNHAYEAIADEDITRVEEM